MSSVYVVIKETTSPILMNSSRPDRVFLSRKDAYCYCEEKNERASSLVYYVHKVKMVEGVK